MTQQLLFRSSHFFRAVTFSEELLFQNNFFFRIVFSEWNLCWAATSWEKVDFQGSYFVGWVTLSELLLWEELVPNKDIYRRATFLNHVLLHSINFIRIDTFSTKVRIQNRYLFRTITLLEKANFSKRNSSKMHTLLFQKTCLFISSYCFRRATFSQHTFSENLLFHNYSSFPQLRFLSIN